MFDAIFQNFYYKLIIASILCLLIAFSKDISLLKNKYVVAGIFTLMVLLVFTDIIEEFGLVLLVAALFALAYNNSMDQ